MRMILVVILSATNFFMFSQISAPHTHTYLALGDSYTIGESVSENERYPMQLISRINEHGYSIQKPKIIAKTGWTTDELKSAIDKEGIYGQTFDMVSLLIGVNNQYRGRDVEIYRKEFAGLLDDAIRFAGNNVKNVFVISIPDWGVTPFGKKSNKPEISKNIDKYNAVNKEETVSKGVRYVDITPESRNADQDNSLIAKDGLHPSAKMYSEWVDLILKELKNH